MPPDIKELELVAHLDKFEEESSLRRDETGIKDAELNLNFVRGQQWPADVPGLTGNSDLQYKFVLNLIDSLLKRKVALLTDTRPQMEVTAGTLSRRGTAATFKNIITAQWDEGSLEQQFTRQMMRAAVLGSVGCLNIWDPSADYGRGDVRYLFYDPRQMIVDPSVTQATRLKDGEFAGVKEVVSLNWIRERFPKRGMEVPPSDKWSRYSRPDKTSDSSGVGGWILSAVGKMARPWSRSANDTEESAVPRQEIRYLWWKDFQRDEKGQILPDKPRQIRHTVDAGGIVLVDEPIAFAHRQFPVHMFDWGMELDHPWGTSDVAGLRRIQYTLNRLVGQIMDNTLLTNRTVLISDTDAVDAKTWALLTSGIQGIAVRKKVGRTFTFTNPAVLPPHLIGLVQLLIQAFDMVSGMNAESRGVRSPGIISGTAISSLQEAAQSIIRLEARAFEDWLSRIFQQSLALIWQYMTTDRLLTMIGPNLSLVEFEFDRAKFLRDDKGNQYPEDKMNDLWQDFRFRVLPGSSLASTRVQRGVMALNLANAGYLPGVEVLRAAEWPDPEGTYQKALEERPQKMLGANGRPPKPVRVPGQRFSGIGN